MHCNMKLAKFALTPPIVAISVALCAALSLFGAGVTDPTWGEAWNSKIGKANFTVTSPSTYCTTGWKRGNCACMFDNSNSTSSDFLCNKSEFPVWVKLVIADSYEEGTDLILKKYTMYGGSNSRMAKSWKIYGATSADAEFDPDSLVLIDSREGVTGVTSLEVDCGVNAASYRTYFINFESNNGDNLLQIPELYLFGEIKEHVEAILYTMTPAYSGLYDGYWHSLVITPFYPASGVTVEYSADGEKWGATAPSYKDIGEYEIFYRLTAEGFPTVEKSVTISIGEPPTEDVDITAAVRAAEKAASLAYHTISTVKSFFNAGLTTTPDEENFVDGVNFSGTTAQRGGWADGNGSLTYAIDESYRPGDEVVLKSITLSCPVSTAVNGTALCMPRNWKLEAYDVQSDEWEEVLSHTSATFPEWTDADVDENNVYTRTVSLPEPVSSRKFRFTVTSGRTHLAEIRFHGDILMADDSVIRGLAKDFIGTYDGTDHGISVSVQNPLSGYTVFYRVAGEAEWSTENPLFHDPIPASQAVTVEWKIEAEGFETLCGSNVVVLDYPDLTADIRAAGKAAGAVYATCEAETATVQDDSKPAYLINGQMNDRCYFTGVSAYYTISGDYCAGQTVIAKRIDICSSKSANGFTIGRLPKNATVYGRNADDEDWILIRDFGALTWSEDEDFDGTVWRKRLDLDVNCESFRRYRIDLGANGAQKQFSELLVYGVVGLQEKKSLVLTASDYEGVYDGVGHCIAVDVTRPAEGAMVYYRWGDRNWTTEVPLFKGPIAETTRTVWWRVEAEGYVTREGANTVTIIDQPHIDLDVTAEVRKAGVGQSEKYYAVSAPNSFTSNDGLTFVNGAANDRSGWVQSKGGVFTYEIKPEFRPGEQIVVKGIAFAGPTTGSTVIDGGKIVLPAVWTLEGSADGETWTTIASYDSSNYPAWGADDIVSAADFGTAYDVYYRRTDFENTAAYRTYRFTFPASRVHISEIYLYGDIGKNRRERLPGLGFSVIVR